MKPSPVHLAVLHEIYFSRIATLTGLGELTRQKVIDMGMMEPPLVDTLGEAIAITSQGEEALRKAKMI